MPALLGCRGRKRIDISSTQSRLEFASHRIAKDRTSRTVMSLTVNNAHDVSTAFALGSDPPLEHLPSGFFTKPMKVE